MYFKRNIIKKGWWELMVHQELSAIEFKKFGFAEAEAWPQFPHPNENTFTISVWGVDTSGKVLKELGLIVDPNYEYYLQGWTTFKFYELSTLELRVTLYEDEKGARFLKQDKKDLKLEKNIRYKNSENKLDYTKYYISCIMKWPFGFCEIMLEGTNKFELEIGEVKIIPLDDYIQEPDRYHHHL
ncbi:hypothetical protein ACFFNY_17245 [Paenibacillus hodogayensis]|uniref:DUF4178 domain-containing protein n=1 Tax=Paenibacillus hodogayensis TaxID=279208 RepID=A0ABV5VYD2_9BACL